ncbi:hypothetical protein [Chryseobacterium oncorhynchi]|uniref:hypothetical protein n=1 Tax=Chryseobacterium oncorhynchi TaxID=741074 RepID=UPI001402F4C6|nr:hypothetical protein [Chryseobacterium oncorhynchi]
MSYKLIKGKRYIAQEIAKFYDGYENIENFFSLYRKNKGKEVQIKINAPEELKSYIF